MESTPRNLDAAFLRDVEAALAEPKFHGMSLGSTLNDALVIGFINGATSWGWRQAGADWLRRLRCLRRFCMRSSAAQHPAVSVRDRILVTWRSSRDRINELLLPVLRRLPGDRTAVLYERADVPPLVPPGIAAIGWAQVLRHDHRLWRQEFQACWPRWRNSLKAVCRHYHLPCGAYQRLALHLTASSQLAIACWNFLADAWPAAILTEHDRASLWSCLVLAARTLGIPTFTMQHGVLDSQATGYTPVLADKMICWGEMHRQRLIAQGEDATRLLIGGCPRLSRDCAGDAAQARSKLGLVADRPLVMLGTCPLDTAARLRLASLFCEAARRLAAVSVAVRLHPSERTEDYAPLAARYPQVRFFSNAASTLDESLAAADVLVVQSSGLGSDALVKRRPVVVVDLPGIPLGHGADMVEAAGCPRVTTAEELTDALQQILFTSGRKEQLLARADHYVTKFCAAFGNDAAALTADLVLANCRIGPGTNTAAA
jgi:hypothetical protein